jgi:general secretion pathway protein D
VGDVRDSSLRGVVADPPVSETTNVTPESLAGNSQVPADRVVLGTGEFVQGARGPERTVFAGDDGVTLNFENAELHEFLRAVFDTILKQNYIVDPAVGGRVTLHTTRPITPEAVLPTVESVLQLNGAAMLSPFCNSMVRRCSTTMVRIASCLWRMQRNRLARRR